jgi:hypothetical protein
VDGHRYTISPSGIIHICVSRADGAQRRYAIKTKPGESVEAMKERMRAKLEAEGVPRIECGAIPDVVPATEDDGSRLSKRLRKDARADAFSPSKGWSAYEHRRVDERHSRTREYSYDELAGFAAGLPSIVAQLVESHSAKRDVTPAVRALQLALAELIDEEEAVAAAEEVEEQVDA